LQSQQAAATGGSGRFRGTELLAEPATATANYQIATQPCNSNHLKRHQQVHSEQARQKAAAESRAEGKQATGAAAAAAASGKDRAQRGVPQTGKQTCIADSHRPRSGTAGALKQRISPQWGRPPALCSLGGLAPSRWQLKADGKRINTCLLAAAASRRLARCVCALRAL